MVVVDDGGVSPPPGMDRRAPRRLCPGAGRRGRDRAPRPAGAGPRRPRTIISSAARQRRSWGSRPGRAAISRTRYQSYAEGMASLRKAGISSRTSIGGASPWRISGLRRVVCARPCAPTSGHCSSRPEQGDAVPARHGGPARGHERATAASRTIWMPPAAPAEKPGAGRARLDSRRTRTAGAWPWPGSRRSQGDLDGALELLDEAERLYVSDFHPDVRPVAALKARVWLAQGRLAEALRLGARAGPVRRRRPQLPARVRAHHARAAAHRPVPEASGMSRSSARRSGCWIVSCRRRKQGRRTGSVIEILVLQALAHAGAGRRLRARSRHWSAR